LNEVYYCFFYLQAYFQHTEPTVQSSKPFSSTINIVTNYSTDQNIVTPSKDTKQLSTKLITSTLTRDKLTSLSYATTTGHAGHDTNMRLTNTKFSTNPTTQRKLNPNTTRYIKQKPHSTATETRYPETTRNENLYIDKLLTADKDTTVTETVIKSIQTNEMTTTTKTTHASSQNNQLKAERQSNGTKGTYSTTPLEKKTESTIIRTTGQPTSQATDTEKTFSQTDGKSTTTGTNQTKEKENSTGTIEFGNTTIQLTTNHPTYQQKTNTRETTLQPIMLKIPISTLDTSLLYKPTTEKQLGEHITSDHHSSDEINGSTEPTSQSNSVKRENSTFDWLVIQRNHESPEEHFRKLGDKEDDRYWPVAVTLIVGIPAIIVIAVSIAVMHKKRLGRPPFSRRKSFASA